MRWLVIGLLAGSGELRECAKQDTSQRPELYLHIARTGCYGRCPIDEVELLPSGEVRYHGRRFVPQIGTYRRRLTPKEREEVQRLFLQSQFNQYAEVYDNPNISDLPSTILTYKWEGKERKIVCRVNCPPELPNKIEKIRKLLAESGEFVRENSSENDTSAED
ncbi:MAG: DUF6438 domain-containing protein [Bacteroidia bacterium]